MFKFKLFFLINIILIVNILPEVQTNEIKRQPLNFGDVVMLTSSKFDRNLWVYSTGNKKQVLVGPSSDIRTKNGPQLFKIKSNVNKKGIVNYGDEILITPLFCADGNKIGYLDENVAFLINKSDPNVLINNISTQSSVFVFKNADFKNVFSGDTLQIWSKPFNKKLYVNYGGTFGSNWYELVFDMKNKDLNKQDFFKIQKVSIQNVRQIFNKKFENDLLKIKELSLKSERIDSLENILRDMNLNISLNNRTAFFNLLKKIYEKKYKLDESDINKLQVCLNQCLKSVLNKEQKDLITSWMQSLEEIRFENIITKKMMLADAAKDFDLKINSYKDVLMLIRNPLGKNKVNLFLNSLEKLFKSKNNMNIVQLNALKNLFQHSEKNFREMNFLSKKDLWLKTLEQNNLDLDFYIKLYEAEHSDGEEKIRRFNKIVPFLSKNVSNDLKLTCLELLNKTLGSKAEELKTIRELLDLAMTKTINNI